MFAPSRHEFDALEVGATVPVTVHLLDGSVQKLDIESSTTVKELVAAVIRNLKMSNSTDFGLFSVCEQLGISAYQSKSTNVCDAIARWEKVIGRYKQLQSGDSKTTPSFKFVFKKGWFMKPDEKTRDRANVHLRYHQVLIDIMAEKHPVTEEEAAFLAALQLRIQGVDPASLASSLAGGLDTIRKVIPSSLVALHDVEEWVELINEASGEIKETAPHRLQRLFLQTVSKWPLYGAAIFFVEKKGKDRERLLLALNKDGVHLLEHGSKTPKKSYPYNMISNYAAGQGSFGIVTGNLVRPERLYFATSQGREIEEIYHGYSMRINARLARHKRNPRKVK